MNETLPKEPVVLAVYPCHRGFGFAVFESMYDAVDWGIRITTKRAVHAISLANVSQLIDWFHPQIIVVQDCTCSLLHCSKYVKKLIDSIVDLATSENIAVRQYKRTHIRECFISQYNAMSKHEVAKSIVKVLPEFEPKLPPPRSLWQSEGYNMPLFDAVSLIFTFYYFEYLRNE